MFQDKDFQDNGFYDNIDAKIFIWPLNCLVKAITIRQSRSPNK